MEFRTTVRTEPFGFRIGHSHRGLLLGSCFAEYVGRTMRRYKLPVTVNPFGTLFNPASVAATLNRLDDGTPYSAGELQQHAGRWVSFDHHGSFDATSPDEALERINRAVAEGSDALRRADYAILTLGTAWIYELRDTGRVVANCHKLPASAFVRRRMTPGQVADTLGNAIERDLAGKRVILTVSPVRHLADGAAANALSKATLILAVHALTERFENCRYFPAYEIMTDDLRDYRFYERDMVHPSETAVQYIWEEFRRAAVDPAAAELFGRIEALQRAAEHRPFDPAAESHREFRRRQADEARKLQRLLPEADFSDEINFFES